MLIDTTRCIACRGCQIACKQANGGQSETIGFHGRRTNPPRLTAKTWNVLDFREVRQDGGLSWHFIKRMCMHCSDPACVSACPVGAMYKTAEGPVLYNGSKCIGCRYCMIACPYDVPGFQWDSNSPYVQKCILCAARVAEGEEPACVQTCPTDSAIFGERNAMLAEAKGRIAAHPDRYVNHVYGEREAGGTSVFYLASVPFDKLGLPNVLPENYPKYTFDSLTKIPGMVSGLAVLLGGLSLVNWRRHRMDKARDEQDDQPAGGEQ
jgi:formate dehydrogenase iron-sulfur subunit